MFSSDAENEENAVKSSNKSRACAKRSSATGRNSKKTAKYKKVKSLGNFCQQFIRLFVTWKDVLSLEEAAK